MINSFGIGYHQYADDTQLYTAVSDTPGSIENLSACADAVAGWHIRKKILLNATKTEALVTGTRQQVAKCDQSSGITISNTTVQYSSKIRVLGVIIDSELSFDGHVTSVVRACNYYIRSLRHIRHLLNKDASNMIARFIALSRLDYCNAVLYGVSDHNISRLQRVQNNLARVVCTAHTGPL